MVISELTKHLLNQGLATNFFFWRDKVGHEIDCLAELDNQLLAVEIKAGKTIVPDYFKELQYWQCLSNSSSKSTFVVYGGEEKQIRQQGTVLSWKRMLELLPPKSS